MKVRMRHTVPVVIVAVALGASGALLAASTGGKDARVPRDAISDCKPAPARCGSEDNDLVIVAANEAARRMLELETTGSTTVTNPTSMSASSAWASADSPSPRDASNQEDPPFAVGQRAVTFVDTSRSTPAANGEAAASTRAIETLVLYPARGKAGDTAVSQAPPAHGRRFPVVVFLHGSGTTGEDYREALEQWAAAGYVVAAPTAPLGGHGFEGTTALLADRSNHPDDVRFVLDELAHELPRALRRITDLDRVAIIGKSLGAATAMQVAFDPSHADDRIRAVVPIAEPPSGEGSEWVDLDLASGNRVPVLFVHGEADEGFAYAASRVNLDTARAPKFLLTLIGASHVQTLSIDGIGAADEAVILGTLDFLDRYAGSDKHTLTRLRRHTNVPGVARLES